MHSVRSVEGKTQKLLKNKEGMKIGAYKLPDRTMPAICVIENDNFHTYGYFRNAKAAEAFIEKLENFMNGK